MLAGYGRALAAQREVQSHAAEELGRKISSAWMAVRQGDLATLARIQGELRQSDLPRTRSLADREIRSAGDGTSK